MAAAFSFNFFEPGPAQAQQGGAGDRSSAASAGGSAEEVPPADAATPAEPPTEVELDGGVRLLKGVVSSRAAAEVLGEPALQASDLVPRKYEGGFKLWEGALDLCSYLISEHQLTPELLRAASPGGSLRGKKVLELGCGHGLPGVLCLLAGATVHFQDFNREVITQLTAPNVQANTARLPGGALREPPRFFAGDWADVGCALAARGLGGHYDLVLAAETIYSLDSNAALLECIKQVLQPPHGVALLAAKSFYFGVGGSTAGFAELVRADGVLECSQVWVREDGVSNKREILRLSFPASITPYFL
ncbi:Histidine methyltransferase 1-like protein [Scenedesmus sp. PABB004]|nr:Histidine methyltransferase 1-like protein [Scenedesmus sp. PABB004]